MPVGVRIGFSSTQHITGPQHASRYQAFTKLPKRTCPAAAFRRLKYGLGRVLQDLPQIDLLLCTFRRSAVAAVIDRARHVAHE